MQNLLFFATVVATASAGLTNGYFNSTTTTSSSSSSVTLAPQNDSFNTSSSDAAYANSTITTTEYTTFTSTKCASDVCTDTLLTAYKSTLTVYDDSGDYNVVVWVPSATSPTTSDASQSTEFVTHTTQKCSNDLCTETVVTALKTTVTLIETDGAEYALTTWVPYITSAENNYAVAAAAVSDGLELAFETVISGSTTYVPSSVSWEATATDYSNLASTTVTVYKCSNDLCSTTVSAIYYSTTYVTDSGSETDVTVYIPYPTETSSSLQTSGNGETVTETVTINSTSYLTVESTTWVTTTAECSSFVRMKAEYVFEPTATEEVTSAIGKIINGTNTSTVYRTMNATLGYNSTVSTNSSSTTIGAANATSLSIAVLPSPAITLDFTTSAAASSYHTIISATVAPQVATTASSSSDSTTTSTLQYTLTKTVKSSSTTSESSTYAPISDSGVTSNNSGLRFVIGLAIVNTVAFFFVL